MINKKDNYVAWALLMYELDDAREHLETMMRGMTGDAEYDEAEYRIDLGHVYAHLNRAWNGRNEAGEPDPARWEAHSRWPSDLEPV